MNTDPSRVLIQSRNQHDRIFSIHFSEEPVELLYPKERMDKSYIAFRLPKKLLKRWIAGKKKG
jgi:hypothetical protein